MNFSQQSLSVVSPVIVVVCLLFHYTYMCIVYTIYLNN